MKNYMIGLMCLFLLLTITGCGSVSNSGTLRCNKSYTDDGDKVTETVVITYKKGMVTKLENTNITEMEDQSMVDMTLAIGSGMISSLNEVKGVTAKYTKEGDNKVKLAMTIDYEALDYEDLKSKLGSLVNDNKYFESKEISIEDFKKNNLSDYICK